MHLGTAANVIKSNLGTITPVLPLANPASDKDANDKSKYIAFHLKTRVGQPTDGTKYKKSVRKFEEDEPHHWITLLRDLDEVWTQNSMNGGTDRASTVRACVQGESLVSFETALEMARMQADGTQAPTSPDHVNTALRAVTESVFPHRALEIQKLWMNKRMFKPINMTTRQTAAAINRLNNALPLFPNGTEASKFSQAEVIGLLEWSLPSAWRRKFDLEGYIPSLGTIQKLIESCEAIERNSVEKAISEPIPKKAKFENTKKGKPDPKGTYKKTPSFYCSHHGKNFSHNTADCKIIMKDGKTPGTAKTSTFSNKNFRKEIYLLAKQSSKEKVLDLYTTAIARERAKLTKSKNENTTKTSKKRKIKDEASDSDSDDLSVNMIEGVANITIDEKHKIKPEPRNPFSDTDDDSDTDSEA